MPSGKQAGNLFTTLLQILFIGLKLTGHIAWSWWWVMAPTWIPVSLALIAGTGMLLVRSFEGPGAKAARALREYADILTRKS